MKRSGFPSTSRASADAGIPPEKRSRSSSLPEVSFDKPAILCNTFVEPTTMEEKVVLSILLAPEVKKISFDIEGEEEQEFVIKLGWPEPMFNIDKMISRPNGTKIFDPVHPKVVALQQALQGARSHISEVPVTTISVKLPVKVNANETTWKKTVNQLQSGSKVIIFEFISTRNDYIVSQLGKTLSFK